MAKENNRFVNVHKESIWGNTSEIWVDKETGVSYLYHGAGYSGGLCVLVDAEGKPVVTKVDEYGRAL